MPDAVSPLLTGKEHGEPSVFLPENLLRDARRQKALADRPVPAICVLDPDGDLVRHLRATGQSTQSPDWACYHTTLDLFTVGDTALGAVGMAVGAPYAVLVAEQMFACGCQFLISITSAGWIGEGAPPEFAAIGRALRDEGTSHHYQPPGRFAAAAPSLLQVAAAAGLPTITGWTTDAPFRETASAIAAARAEGAQLVEMEAAGLYAFAAARHRRVLCIAHLTNALAVTEGDFEKGEANGALAVLALLARLAAAWSPSIPEAAP